MNISVKNHSVSISVYLFLFFKNVLSYPRNKPTVALIFVPTYKFRYLRCTYFITDHLVALRLSWPTVRDQRVRQ